MRDLPTRSAALSRRSPPGTAKRRDLLCAGRAAAEAGVRTLVLNHLVPGNATDEELAPAASFFPGGRVVIGQDLLEIGLR